MKTYALLVTVASCLTAADNPADRIYQAIRNNDLGALRTLIQSNGPNVGDARGTTPLIMAAAFGSIDAMRTVLDAGADVNAASAFGVTPLMACPGNLDRVRLLVSKGAKVNAASQLKRTPLMLAAAAGASDVVKFLLAAGADVDATEATGLDALMFAAEANATEAIKLLLARGASVKTRQVTPDARPKMGLTPLMNAAGHGNTEIVRLMLAKGADVNAVSPPQLGPGVKNGPVAIGSLTALLLTVAYGNAETVKLLLDAGADPNARDVRGYTPLTLAVATDYAQPEIVKALLAKGADPSIKGKDGTTPSDWALKTRNPAILDALGIPNRPAQSPVALREAAGTPLPSARDAAERGLALLQQTSPSFFKEGGCASCHSHNLLGMAAAAAKRHGLNVNWAAAQGEARMAKLFFQSQEPALMQRLDGPAGPDIMAYTLAQIAALAVEPDRTTDAIVHNLAAQQQPSGNWRLIGIARPPLEDGDFSRTALCIRALQVYGAPARKAEFGERITRAANWLRTSAPMSTEDRNMRALGLKWAGAPQAELSARARDLLAAQCADGGWSQTPNLASDAYATGQTLYTLSELGVLPSHKAYERGLEFLRRTQKPDGSWHVASRALKFQPYFQSGFPHDHDQWISSAATAWAVMALAPAAPSAGKKQAAAARL